jgi:hypothetical protein
VATFGFELTITPFWISQEDLTIILTAGGSKQPFKN